VPHIANMLPGGEHYLEDLDAAGGIPAVMNRLKGKLNKMPTVSGRTISDIASKAEIMDEDVIRPLS
ncbi:MAG: dihydroxy-acid dehydratase, partial [Armatimonadetes bacterium]|nr:dihydroxy-acid dehydratase [Armatimonadota bacterium]NIO96134.1 dihydroxy-acid dehydratase [Armatimonadota bacterium]